MSFTSDVKKELSTKVEKNMHCRVAIIAALISSCTDIMIDENDNYKLVFMTDTEITAETFKELVEKTFKVEAEIGRRTNPLAVNNVTYQVVISDSNIVKNVLEKINLVDKYGEQTDWGPHYVVLFGYSFNFGATDALKKNLPLLNEGEKQIKINIDIRY